MKKYKREEFFCCDKRESRNCCCCWWYVNLGFNSFFFFGWATNWAQSLNGARGLRQGRVRAPGKKPA